MNNTIISCLQSRLAWYDKAIAMATDTIAWDNHFDWPSFSDDTMFERGAGVRNSVICEWRGAARELKNTLDMLNSTVYGGKGGL